jgi:purine-nucleoside/S-methyl-5'-thioadenosine phosphorylase / adenosine deaminase
MADPSWIDASPLLGNYAKLVFSDRCNGVSHPPFDSLNLGFRSGDDPEHVRRNRGLVASTLGIERDRFIYLEQVHGTAVRRASALDGAKTTEPGDSFKETDGTYTLEPLTVLAVLTADCLPLALAHEGGLFVAMLHAGWKGTIENIVASALQEIARDVAFDPADIRAVMGPAIGPCCYEVDEGRAGIFIEKYGDDDGVVRWGEKPSLNLYKANRINLLKAGLKEERIKSIDVCTCCESRYFSFRREGRTGRQGAFIFLT